MGNNIENRITKLEGRLGANQPAETLDEMIAKFERGEYRGKCGNIKPFDVARGAWYAPDIGQYFESLCQWLPGPLVDWLKKTITTNISEVKGGM